MDSLDSVNTYCALNTCLYNYNYYNINRTIMMYVNSFTYFHVFFTLILCFSHIHHQGDLRVTIVDVQDFVYIYCCYLLCSIWASMINNGNNNSNIITLSLELTALQNIRKHATSKLVGNSSLISLLQCAPHTMHLCVCNGQPRQCTHILCIEYMYIFLY